MSDGDPWARSADPTVHVIPSQRATLPPPGVPLTPARSRWPLALGIALGTLAVVLVLGLVLAVAVPLFLSQREKGQEAADQAGRSESQVADGVVDGFGYRYALPAGWVDAAEALPEMPLGGSVDTATMLEAPDGNATSVLFVEVESTRDGSIEELESVWRRNAAASLPEGADLRDAPGTTIGGSDAAVVTADRVVNERGGAVDFRTLLTIRGERAYALTFMFQAGAVDQDVVVEEALASWEWE